jgi:hypothetical protein
LVLLLEQQLQILLIGKGSGDASIFEDIDNFNQWLNISTSNSAIFLRSLKENKLNDLGNVDAVYLPDLVTNEISNMLYNSDFIKHPTHGNKPCETTPYSRQINKPLIQQLTTTNGSGLLSRSVAQLLEIFTLLDKVKTQGSIALTNSLTLSLKSCLFSKFNDLIIRYNTPLGWKFHCVGDNI